MLVKLFFLWFFFVDKFVVFDFLCELIVMFFLRSWFVGRIWFVERIRFGSVELGNV